MKKETPYLEFYRNSINAGKMVRYTSGLCDFFEGDPLFELMKPTDFDLYHIGMEGKKTFTWGSDSRGHKFHEFTPLRQNIVLLMAAMNGEL